MKRTYGNESTDLVLTGKALAFYGMSSDIRIIEEKDEETGECLYQVVDDIERKPMHDGMMDREKLIRWLEDGYEEYVCANISSTIRFKIQPEFLHLWGDDATTETELTVDDIEMIARGWDKTIDDVINDLIPANYESAVALMDDDIREQLHADLAPCTEAKFLLEYCLKHAEKYGEAFEI